MALFFCIKPIYPFQSNLEILILRQGLLATDSGMNRWGVRIANLSAEEII